jgi:DNA repair exonuclease SbcCD ATPase subunit
MLKLKNLTLSGIGRFVKEQSIEFTTLGSLVQVDGENRNTNGSSGSGKSTLFNALDYLLGLNDLPTTVLQSRLTKDPISVIGTFDWDGQEVVIERSKKGFSISVAGQVVEGSSKLTEEKLDQILGMSRDLFRKILHKRQKEGGFFLDFTPKQMYAFLTDCLNLKEEQKKLDIVEAKLKELETKKSAGQQMVLTLQSSLSATQESILALGLPPIRDIHQPVVLELKGKYDDSKKKHEEVEQRHRVEAQELEARRPQTKVEAYDVRKQEALASRQRELERACTDSATAERTRVSRVNQDISALSTERYRLGSIVREGENAKVSASQLASEIKKIRDAICPTCEQSWVTDTAKLKETELLTKLAKLKEAIQSGALATEALKKAEADLLAKQTEAIPVEDPEVPKMRQEILQIEAEIKAEKLNAANHIALQNAANSSILQHFAAEQSSLRARQMQEAEQARGQMDVDRRAFEAAAMKLKAFNDAHARYETALKNMKENEGQYQSNLSLAKTNLAATEKEYAKAEELRKVTKAHISSSFDEALETIGDAATKLIRCIPNMSNATIQFEGQKETKDGKIKEEVNAVISMDGFIGIPIKSLSGGERSSVDLAVDLSVIDFVESKSAKGIDVFILDEPFTGLDTVSVEMALEVLKNSNSNKRLIVVDHNPEVKQMVSNRLVVVREGDTSNVQSQEQ